LLTSPGFSLILNAVNIQWWHWFLGGIGIFLLFFWRVKDWNFFIRLALILAVVGANYGVGIIRPELWGHLKEYQQKRLTSFVNPYADPRGSGYHILQSLIAIGSGGVTGTGLGKGNQSQGAFLSYMLICMRALIIAFHCRGEPEGSAMAIGLMCMFIFHSFINLGMTMGIMPVTGVPLPFLSYGGTALLVDMIALGLLQSIYGHIPKPKKDAWSS
ncbi:MAG TPA: FtsW/RodA/SpoVE family cell cycle protein, partial [Candidatus Melainabacteria bacterium]|nr:FtsW/RodA/SpoVE family cell cycle protein [Candidatus Melainabacteria bacterium]